MIGWGKFSCVPCLLHNFIGRPQDLFTGQTGMDSTLSYVICQESWVKWRHHWSEESSAVSHVFSTYLWTVNILSKDKQAVAQFVTCHDTCHEPCVKCQAPTPKLMSSCICYRWLMMEFLSSAWPAGFCHHVKCNCRRRYGGRSWTYI